MQIEKAPQIEINRFPNKQSLHNIIELEPNGERRTLSIYLHWLNLHFHIAGWYFSQNVLFAVCDTALKIRDNRKIVLFLALLA